MRSCLRFIDLWSSCVKCSESSRQVHMHGARHVSHIVSKEENIVLVARWKRADTGRFHGSQAKVAETLRRAMAVSSVGKLPVIKTQPQPSSKRVLDRSVLAQRHQGLRHQANHRHDVHECTPGN